MATISSIAWYLRKNRQQKKILGLTLVREADPRNKVNDVAPMQELLKEFYNKENLDLANWNLHNEISNGGLVVLGCFMVDAKLSKDVLLQRLRGIETECPYGNFFGVKII